MKAVSPPPTSTTPVENFANENELDEPQDIDF